MAFDRCIFDIETDGLLDTITRVHHIAIMDADTEELASYHTEEELDDALKTLRTARLVEYRRVGKTLLYSLADEHVKSITEKGLEHIREL